MAAIIQKLSNNIPVIVEEMKELRSVTFGVYVGSGSQNEDRQNNGVAHAVEHMLFKGTTGHTAAQLADVMTELGGGVNAYTSKENTVFYGKVLLEDFGRAAALVAEMIKDSLLDPREFLKEKQVIIEEIEAYDDSAEDMCHELLQKMVWRDNPLGFIISGSKGNVKKLTCRQLAEFIRDNYTADNIVISLAGKITPREAVKLLEPLFGRNAARALPLKGNKKEPEKPEFHRCFFARHKDMEQVHLNIAFDNVTNGHEDRYAMFLVNSLLGGNLNSRLFQRVREENGLTYSIYSYNSMCDLAGLFHIYASMSAPQTPKVMELILQIVEELGSKGIDERELALLKKQTRTELILGSETANSIVLNNARTYVTGGRVISLDEAVKGYEAVSLEQINRCIRTYLRRDKYSVCLVGNVRELPLAQMKREWRQRNLV